ncbi:MAG: octanoyltransferase [Psychrobacter sp.]|nr:octanoyltransferase [Psychrobacter sp.]
MPNTMQALNTPPLNDAIITKSIIAADYVPTLDAMLARTLARIALKKEQGLRTPDELWIVDHNDVYTLGQAGKEEHILQRTNTPIIKTDRGGQVTWHGHGQLVMYWLFDLDSIGWSVRNMVSHAEQAIEDVVNDCLKSPASNDIIYISARARRDAPGVYLYADTAAEVNDNPTSTDEIEVDNTIMIGKIASLGFKIKHGFSYHGIAINLDCDLSAFNAINPCGYAGMQMLRLADFVNMNQATNAQPNNLPLTDDEKILTYEQFTQQLIDNIAQRHAGETPLRELAPKQDR